MKNYLLTPMYLTTIGGVQLTRVETDRQLRNGTLVFECETVESRYYLGTPQLVKVKDRYASYASGYVRRITNRMYPINKRKAISIFRETHYVDSDGNEIFASGLPTSAGHYHKTTLLPNEEDRLTLLSSYLDKKFSPNSFLIVLPNSIKTL